MSITGFIILLAVIWFITLLIILPIGLRTQADENERIEGTQSGAPSNFVPKKVFIRVSIWAIFIWAILVGLIIFTKLDVTNIDLLGWNTLDT